MKFDGLTMNQLAERNAVLVQELEKAREVTNCPQGVDLQDHLKQLVAENLAIKAMNDCLAEELRGYESDGAFDGPNMHLLWWKCDTQATDSILRAAEARGVEKLTDRLQQFLDDGDFVGDEIPVIAGAIYCGKELSEQLREGKA
ncbi:TPA: hypothetical protein ACURJP_003694 [Escherichia coli]